MWGEGGRVYWGTSRGEEREAEGIVVVFAWLSSEERNLRPYVELYASLGWRCLVCHSDFLTLFFPEKASSLACNVLNELVKEVKIRPLPIVFVSFSGGSKGCLYKVLQLLVGKCSGQLHQDEYKLVGDCVCGQIYDSSPVDFTSDLGTRFVLHPSVLKMSHPPRLVSWMAKAVASTLDTLFINRFEEQRAEYWQTLYSSSSMGPFLIFCSEDDELAPYHVVSDFAQHLLELGAEVKLVKWRNSSHVAHYKYYQADYRAAVTELLGKSAVIYSRRRQLNKEARSIGSSSDGILESVCSLHKAAVNSNESLVRVAIRPSDHFFLPSSVEYHETRDAGSMQDEQEGKLFNLQNRPGINAHGVLSQILFDVCVPRNVEGWDIKPTMSMNGQHRFTSARRHGHFNPIKCIRSRL